MDRELPETGERLGPDWALQHPQDYIEVLCHAVPEAVETAGVDPETVLVLINDDLKSARSVIVRPRAGGYAVRLPAASAALLTFRS